MRAGIKSILLILACAVLFGAGFRPRPLPAAAYAATGYSFAGALRAWKESLGPPLPEAVLLDVPVVYQWPEMPNGCEATALTMLLQYYGFAADKLPPISSPWHTIISPARTSPTPGFPPTGRTLPPPTQAIRRCSAFTAWPLPWPKEQTVILRNRTARCARWISAARTVTCSEGASLRDGRWWSGRPSAYSDYSWRLYSDSSVYHPYKNLHCLVVCGYDADYFYIRDPLYGALQIECGTFLLRYAEMERRAVVLSEAPPDASALYPGGARLS